MDKYSADTCVAGRVVRVFHFPTLSIFVGTLEQTRFFACKYLISIMFQCSNGVVPSKLGWNKVLISIVYFYDCFNHACVMHITASSGPQAMPVLCKTCSRIQTCTRLALWMFCCVTHITLFASGCPQAMPVPLKNFGQKKARPPKGPGLAARLVAEYLIHHVVKLLAQRLHRRASESVIYSRFQV